MSYPITIKNSIDWSNILPLWFSRQIVLCHATRTDRFEDTPLLRNSTFWSISFITSIFLHKIIFNQTTVSKEKISLNKVTHLITTLASHVKDLHAWWRFCERHVGGRRKDKQTVRVRVERGARSPCWFIRSSPAVVVSCPVKRYLCFIDYPVVKWILIKAVGLEWTE